MCVGRGNFSRRVDSFSTSSHFLQRLLRSSPPQRRGIPPHLHLICRYFNHRRGDYVGEMKITSELISSRHKTRHHLRVPSTFHLYFTSADIFRVQFTSPSKTHSPQTSGFQPLSLVYHPTKIVLVTIQLSNT